MKKFTLVLGAALMVLVMASCGSKKAVTSNYPCPDCKATSDVFRYLGQHVVSSDRQMQQARSMAANAARVQEIARTVVNQQLKGTPVVCEGTMPGSQPGNTICFACVELTGKSVLDGIASQISNDEKLRTDFEYEKFKKVLEEVMSKLQ